MTRSRISSPVVSFTSGHCQLGDDRALLSLVVVQDLVQLSARHCGPCNEGPASQPAVVSGARRLTHTRTSTRARLSIDAEEILHDPWTDAKPCRAADSKRRMWRPRCRVGWWETSTRLLAYWSVISDADGPAGRYPLANRLVGNPGSLVGRGDPASPATSSRPCWESPSARRLLGLRCRRQNAESGVREGAKRSDRRRSPR